MVVNSTHSQHYHWPDILNTDCSIASSKPIPMRQDLRTCVCLTSYFSNLQLDACWCVKMYIDTNLLADYNLPDTDIIFDCQFHPEKNGWVGFCTIEGDVKVVNFENGNQSVVTNLKRHHKGSSIRKIRFWDNLLLSAAKTIKVTDLSNGKVVRKIDNDKKKIYSLLVADEYLVCAGDDEGNFKVWDYRMERPVHISLRECDGYISDLDIDSSRRVVVASSGEGTLTAFNLRARRMEDPQSELFDSGFQCVRFAEEKHKVVVGTEDGVLNLFNENEWGNISDRFPVKQNNTGTCSIDCLEMLGEENFLVMGCSDGSLQAVSLFPNKPLNVISKHVEGVESLDVHQVNKQLVATSQNNVQLFSYEVIKSEKKARKLKKGTGFFDGLES